MTKHDELMAPTGFQLGTPKGHEGRKVSRVELGTTSSRQRNEDMTVEKEPMTVSTAITER